MTLQKLFFNLDCFSNAIQAANECVARTAEVKAETMLISVSAECGAVVEHHMGFVDKFVGQFFVRKIIVAEVEPSEVGSLGKDSL